MANEQIQVRQESMDQAGKKFIIDESRPYINDWKGKHKTSHNIDIEGYI